MAKKSMIEREKRRKYAVRLRNRCRRCGRPRGYMRRFGLCRICFRELANQENPGVVNQVGSWVAARILVAGIPIRNKRPA